LSTANWDAASPFFAAALFVLIGQLTSALVRRRVRKYFEEQVEEGKVKVTSELAPASISMSGDFSADATQIAGCVFLPVAGFIVLVQAHLSRWVPAAYFGTAAVALGLLLWILRVPDPTTYARKYKYIGLSIANLIALSLNVILAIGALLLTTSAPSGVPTPCPHHTRPPTTAPLTTASTSPSLYGNGIPGGDMFRSSVSSRNPPWTGDRRWRRYPHQCSGRHHS
jgi:hypothetical protein